MYYEKPEVLNHIRWLCFITITHCKLKCNWEITIVHGVNLKKNKHLWRYKWIYSIYA